jgi:hypothetical protein
MTTLLEFGLDTFGGVTKGAAGAVLPHAQVIRNVIEEAVLADQLGIDFIGIGEHHRADFAISSPEVVLAAIAARTWRIRLGSSVTVLSSDTGVSALRHSGCGLEGPRGGERRARFVHRILPAVRFRPAPV